MRGLWRLQQASWRCSQVAGGVRRRVRTGVALTFDDGPDPVFTPQVLDVLGEHGVPGTFFFVGALADEHPDLVRRAVDEGHAVGSHTQTHPDLGPLDHATLCRQIDDGRGAVSKAGGRRTDLFRPCKGHVDWTVARALRSTGVEAWLWTKEPRDWHPDTTADQIVARLARLRDGDVVLLHDGLEQPLDARASDRSATVAALPAVIESARAGGVTFSALGDDR